jgi:lysozyme
MNKIALALLGTGFLAVAYYYFTRKTDSEDVVQFGDSIVTRINLAVNTITGTYLDKALSLIANQEGFSSRAYPDPPNQNQTYSIGYGHQIRQGDGLSLDSVVTETVALQLLAADAGSADACVGSSVTVPLNDNQRAALVSFCYNVGCGAFKSSTMLQYLNAGDYGDAANEFSRWVYANGIVVDALVSRRGTEKGLFLA